MPRRNRVTPLGELISTPERGLIYGNRGCLHDAAGEIRWRWATRRWIACRLEFRGRRRSQLMAPGRYTELFFLDEATAFAAGHRPCAECRRQDYNRFIALLGGGSADAVDVQLHAERVDARTGARRFHSAAFEELPDGAFVLWEREPWVIAGERLLHWSPAGYQSARVRPNGENGTVITPPSMLAVLGSGWESVMPLLHPMARDATLIPSRS